MYSALEKLYGLKLFDGLITEDRIPARFKDNAIAYAESLKPVEPEEPEITETPDNSGVAEETTPETPESDSETPSENNNENIQTPEETPKTDESGTNEDTSETITDSESEGITTDTDVETEPEDTSVTEESETTFDLMNTLLNTEAGSTVTLAEDVHLTEDFSVNKAVTIDLNGHNITSDASVIYLRSANADLTVVGEGNVTAGSGGDYFAARAATGKLNIAGGTWSVGADAEGQGNSCIYASGSGEINISGGEFSTDAAYNDKYFVLNRKNGSDSTIIVTGGLFHDYNPADGDDNDGGNFVAVGYTSVFNEEKQAWEIVPAVDNTTTEDNSETEETVIDDNQSEIIEDSTTETTSSEIEETVTEETLVENETEVTE